MKKAVVNDSMTQIFPDDFMFQLTKEDISDILKKEVEKLNKKECMKNAEQFGKRNS